MKSKVAYANEAHSVGTGRTWKLVQSEKQVQRHWHFLKNRRLGWQFNKKQIKWTMNEWNGHPASVFTCVTNNQQNAEIVSNGQAALSERGLSGDAPAVRATCLYIAAQRSSWATAFFSPSRDRPAGQSADGAYLSKQQVAPLACLTLSAFCCTWYQFVLFWICFFFSFFLFF